jgi:hypothetical protein
MIALDGSGSLCSDALSALLVEVRLEVSRHLAWVEIKEGTA